MKRLDIHEDVLFGEDPAQTIMVESPDGVYVTFKDFTAILDTIAKSDPDLSPRVAVINAVFDAFGNTK